MLKYKSLFIDLDDTIWDTNTNARNGMIEIFHHYKLNDHFESFEHYYDIYTKKNFELWDLYHFGKIKKHELITQRFLHPLSFIGVQDEQLAIQMNHDFLECTAAKTQLIPHAREILDYLSPNYRLFVLSNGFRDTQIKKLQNANLLSYFDKVIVSEDAGVNKPHPDIYHYALKSTNSRKSQSIMIGDNPHTDITGAYQIKMDQIFFANNKPFKLDFQPSFIVNHLQEIETIL